MEKLIDLVTEGEAEEAAARVRVLLERGNPPETIMDQALVPAMDAVGDLFQSGVIYLPEMLIAARAMKAGLGVLRPLLVGGGNRLAGRVVLGTAKGDMHDIGKNLVGMALEGAGFEVIDLGVDVSPMRFVESIKEHRPMVLGLSALLTTTMEWMGETIRAIQEAGLRDSVKIMVGGAPVTRDYSDEIGADFYGPDPTAGRDFVRGLLG